MALASLRSLRASRTVKRATSIVTIERPVLHLWLRHSMRNLILIPATQFAAWVLALLLPSIFARAFGPAAVTPLAITVGVFTLFSLLRALFAFRLIEAGHPGTTTGAWVAASVLADLFMQLGISALLLLTPFGGQLGDATVRGLCLVGGGAVTALLQWRMFAPRTAWSWLWVAGAAAGWWLCAVVWAPTL